MERRVYRNLMKSSEELKHFGNRSPLLSKNLQRLHMPRFQSHFFGHTMGRVAVNPSMVDKEEEMKAGGMSHF